MLGLRIAPVSGTAIAEPLLVLPERSPRATPHGVFDDLVEDYGTDYDSEPGSKEMTHGTATSARKAESG